MPGFAGLVESLLIGGVLVVLVLLIFLWDWRIALISATIIPLTMVITLLVLSAFGTTLNVMVLAGLVIAIPLLLLGLYLSPVEPLPSEGGYIMEGNSLLYLGAKYLIHGQILPSNGADVMLHPIAFAAWFGLLVTAFNLLPVGQLDGGHVIFTLIGDKIRYVGTIFVVILVVMGVAFWPGWFLWATLIFLLGVGHPPPLNDVTPLGGRRKLVAVLTIFIFLLVFAPIPLKIIPLN